MQILLKNKDFKKSVMCQYLRNESPYLYKILNLSSYDRNAPLQKICAERRTLKASTYTRIFCHGHLHLSTERACLGPDLYDNLSCGTLISYEPKFKFHKDRSFCCGDICKTILTFFNH